MSRTKFKILNLIGPLIVIVAALLLMSACATKPDIDARPIVDCPQPPADAIAQGSRPSEVPRLDGADPAQVVVDLSTVIVEAFKAYGDEADKRRTLVDHGVMFCGWTK